MPRPFPSVSSRSHHGPAQLLQHRPGRPGPRSRRCSGSPISTHPLPTGCCMLVSKPDRQNRYYRTQGRAWEEGSPRAGLPCVSSDRGTAQRVPWAQAAPIGQLRRGTETAPAGHTLWCSAAPLAPATRLEAACSCPEKEIGYRAARDPGSCDIIQRFAFCHGRAAAVGKFPSHC